MPLILHLVMFTAANEKMIRCARIFKALIPTLVFRKLNHLQCSSIGIGDV